MTYGEQKVKISTQATRPRRTHVKSGCRTCKIRKVKCDEGRPACHRCVSVGRVCDGYGIWGGGGTVHSGGQSDKRVNADILRQHDALSLPPQIVDKEEYNCLEWFVRRTAIKLPGAFVSTFWDRLVLQASYSEPAILHAAVTLSCADKMETRGVDNSAEQKNGMEQFLLQQYSKAIADLQPHFKGQSRESVRTALITCLLFVCMEFYRGRFRTGNAHLLNGLNLLVQFHAHSEAGSGEGIVALKAYPETVDDWITETFIRLHGHAGPFGQCHLLPLRIVPVDLPDPIFESSDQAKHYLDRLLLSISCLSEHARVEWVSKGVVSSPALKKRRLHLQTKLAAWFKAYEAVGAKTSEQKTQMTTRQVVAHKLLHSYYLMADIMAEVSIHPGQEMFFDARTQDFLAIILQAMNIHHTLASKNVLESINDYWKETSSTIIDLGGLPPLYYTALKCRSHHIRSQAINLLNSRPHRYGIWDSKLAASIANTVMNVEEKGYYAARASVISHIGKDLLKPELPESYRIHQVNVILPDHPSEGAQVICRRKLYDGSFVVERRRCGARVQPEEQR
ncbi:hypothetical protein EJ04DRAFT_588692 [Polyplosphaeria fusca]|uniref:Zn(2)-C6 fungal-type domain-containing protein n=1 Tax=Polyplosphaeria fusca TaxID=682080 RepID=A0A9P4QNB7_9PLEO|nr:hypothetical protein EJ04DRAFT_588692 [Polyplosphaeria fusca]